MKFKPGERARIVYTNSRYRHLVGKECTIVSAMTKEQCDRVGMVNRPAYYIEIDGVRAHPAFRFCCDELSLAKILPPGWDKTTWDDCPWQPKELVAA